MRKRSRASARRTRQRRSGTFRRPQSRVVAGPGVTLTGRKGTGARRTQAVDVDGARPGVLVAESEVVVLLPKPKRSEFGISRREHECVLSCASGELGRWVEWGDADAIPISSSVSGA